MGTDFGPILIFEICYSDNGVKSIVHCEMLSSDVWKKKHLENAKQCVMQRTAVTISCGIFPGTLAS